MGALAFDDVDSETSAGQETQAQASRYFGDRPITHVEVAGNEDVVCGSVAEAVCLEDEPVIPAFASVVGNFACHCVEEAGAGVYALHCCLELAGGVVGVCAAAVLSC